MIRTYRKVEYDGNIFLESDNNYPDVIINVAFIAVENVVGGVQKWPSKSVLDWAKEVQLELIESAIDG